MALKTIALLARTPGLSVLSELNSMPNIKLEAVYTHGRLPKAEGGGVRGEVAHYRRQSDLAKCPLYLIDGPDIKPAPEDFNLLIALSWRYKIPRAIYGKAKTAAINLHRGELPKYPGAEPVRRAMEAAEKYLEVTAHHLVEEIDGGPVICSVKVPNIHKTPEYAKTMLYPVYAPLARIAISMVQ